MRDRQRRCSWGIPGPVLLPAVVACILAAPAYSGTGFVTAADEGGVPLFTAEHDRPLASGQDGDFFGASVAGAGDVNGDGYADVVVGAPRYDNRGAVFIHHGGPMGISVDPAVRLDGDQAHAQFGSAVAGAGDVNGDGYADVIVGAYQYDGGQSGEGAAFVFLGGHAGIGPVGAVRLEVDQAGARFGWSVAGAGDVNGDGYADVVVGADKYDGGLTNEGAVFVFHGSATGIGAVPDRQLEVDQADAAFGHSVDGAGDVDGDGYADIIAGAPRYGFDQLQEGAAFVYLGSPGGIDPSSQVGLQSDQASAAVGTAVAGAGDVNADGYADVIVGAPHHDGDVTREGQAFVYHGSASGISPGWDARLGAGEADSAFGNAVAAAGDVDADGYADVIVGAYAYDGQIADSGAALVYRGGIAGLVTEPVDVLVPDQSAISFATVVAAAGDVTANGHGDVIVGARRYVLDGPDSGAAFVHHGTAEGVEERATVAVDTVAGSGAGDGGSGSSGGGGGGGGGAIGLIGVLMLLALTSPLRRIGLLIHCTRRRSKLFT